MNINDHTICVVDVTNLHVHNFYTSSAGARDVAQALNEKYPEYQHKVMIFEEFLRRERDKWITNEVTFITREQYWEMLEILPPLNWIRGDSYETFHMSEFMTGNYTEQYGQKGDIYIHKMTDYADKSTWITLDDFKKAE